MIILSSYLSELVSLHLSSGLLMVWLKVPHDVISYPAELEKKPDFNVVDNLLVDCKCTENVSLSAMYHGYFK